ncbi:phytol kinase [Haematococcus lacustris]
MGGHQAAGRPVRITSCQAVSRCQSSHSRAASYPAPGVTRPTFSAAAPCFSRSIASQQCVTHLRPPCQRRGALRIAHALPTTLQAAASLLDSTQPFARDSVLCIIAGLASVVWTKLFDLLVKKNLLEQKLSRKLVHATVGPLFVMAWPLFSMSPSAPMWAAVVPAANAVRLAAVGSGVWEDPGLVASVSREGGRRELLKGPLCYCGVLVLATLLAWRSHPAGLVAVSMMCGGDGLADIVGRRYGATNKLAWNPAKSAAGSLAMLLGGTTMALGLLTLFWSLGYLTWSQARGPLDLLPQVLVCSAVATLVESLPINHVLDDNWTVPLVAAVFAVALLPT